MNFLFAGSADPGPLPSFTNTPTNVTAYTGSEVKLRCGVEHLGTKTVSKTVKLI